MPTAVPHSHRPTTKVSHKPFKSKAATKHELRDRAKGKVERSQRKTPHQQVMSKLDRRNQAKQARITKHKEHLKGTSVFSGREAAPRIVAVIPLCADGDATAAIQQLNGGIDIDAASIETKPGNFRVSIDRFKQQIQYVPVQRNLNACLDAARVADFVIIVLSGTVEVDSLGDLILRGVESQGLSSLFTVVQGLDKVESAKQRPGVVSSLKSYITHFHPDQDKLYSLDNRQECANLMRSLCNATPKGVRWRDERSWMLAEEVKFAYNDSDSTVITGVVRGRGLNADRLVQIGDWGTYQIEKIVAAPLSKQKKKNEEGGSSEMEEERILEQPTEDLDDLTELAPEEVVMAEEDQEEGEEINMDEATSAKKGVLLDDHHYFSDEDDPAKQPKKKVPKGTSEYQSAWYLDDVSDSGSDMEDVEMEDNHAEEDIVAPEDGLEGRAQPEPTEGAPSEYPQSEMMQELDDEEEGAQLAEYRSRKHDEADDDLEFPDEIELHPNVLARERLARYRGLKSLRTSVWQEDEDRAHEPEEWRRLLQIPDYQSSKSRATREALVGGVEPGTRVMVYVKGIPAAMEKSYNPAAPVTLFSLFRHENKKTAVNYLINMGTDYDKSIKSKEELIVQCGPRRMVIKPLFSQAGTTPNNVHKYSRFLHPGSSAIATFTGPVTWGAVPVLFFKKTTPGEVVGEGDSPSAGLTLVATGTALPPSTSRVIAKRVILTGHPYHINKKVVTIRYMFFSREDVEWFKAMPLWTRRGRSGFIKEALGTHGYFKATFDGKMNPQDAIGVSLYKRVWPRNAVPIQGPLLELEAAETAAETADALQEMEIS